MDYSLENGMAASSSGPVKTTLTPVSISRDTGLPYDPGITSLDIALIVLMSVLILVGLFLAVYFWRRHKKKKDGSSAE
jgi:hypothetical protein